MIFIILDNKQIFPLYYKETLSLSSNAVHYTNVLEKIIQKPLLHTWNQYMLYVKYISSEKEMKEGT